ncbi:Imm74 family immunity protein [Apibacter adventoris]|uniref:Uncharacterized protein n=1 Tax=Apibacter adventoris TaxID=1679466 RepID=A0A2S8AFV3_9FLAO|nr:Imm74 family immunity protein [Apibacter adventoris]PQL95237.1 hypothetical protein C4S77_00050 [Apibacter adventoris]
MEILSITRGQIKVKLDNDVLSVNGEAMMPQQPPNLSEYVVYKNSFKWVTKNDNLSINDKLRTKLLIFLENELRKRSLKIIIE